MTLLMGHPLNRHLMPHSIKRVLRWTFIVTAALLLLVLLLAVTDVIHLPATAVAVWALTGPLIAAAIVAGFMGPLAAGMLSVAFSRAELGQYIVVGNLAAPLAEGHCVGLSFMDIQLRSETGVESVTWSYLQGQPMTILDEAAVTARTKEQRDSVG